MTQYQINSYLDKTIKLMLMTMLLMVPLVFYTKTHDVFEINKITAFRLLTLIAGLVFFIKHVLNRTLTFRPSPLMWPMLFIGLTSLAATIISNNQLTSLIGVYEDFEGIITIANYILLFVIIHQTTNRLDDVKKYLLVIILAGTLTTGYGIAQNFGIDFIRWNPNTYTAARMFGSLGNPNFLAAYALMSLPLAWMFFITAKKLSSKLIFLILAGVMVVAIFFTKSRGAVYGLAIELTVFSGYLIYDYFKSGQLWETNKRWLIICTLLASITLLAPEVRQTVKTTIARTAATLNISKVKMTPRLYIWKSALKMMVDKPWLGSGLDTFQITFPKYRLPLYWQLEWNGTPEKAHNFFLQIGATTGLLGLAAWLWLLVTYFSMIVNYLRQLKGERRHLLMAMAIAQLGFLVQNQFNFTVIAYGSVFWFFLGLVPTIGREEPTLAAKVSQPFLVNKLTTKQTGLIVMLVLVFVGAMFWSLRVWTADVYFKRGIILLSRGYAAQALPELHRAASINPLREIYWVKEGIAYETMAKINSNPVDYLKKAEAIHLHTVAMNKLNGYNFNNLGRVYKYWGEKLDKKKLLLAEQACQQAVGRDPYNAYFNLDLASVQISLQKWNEVEKTSKRLVALFPDFAMPYAYLGYVALMRSNKTDAHRFLSLAAEKNWRGDIQTRSSTLSNLGYVRAELGQLDGALKVFNEALTLNPNYVQARYNKGLVLERLGESHLALSEYRIIVSQAPHYGKLPEIKQRIAQLERGMK